MTATPVNKYRKAAEILHRGRELLVSALADEVLDSADDLLDGGYGFNEFLENQGTRMHFLSLLVAQLEMSADEVDERAAAAYAAAKAGKRRTRRSRTPRKRTSSDDQPARDRKGSADES